MGIFHTGPYVSSELSDEAKIKRAISRTLDTSVADDTVAILYTSTAITVTAVFAYITETVTNNAQTIDVGVPTGVNAIVAAGPVADLAADTVNELTIAAGAVAADEVITARVLQEFAGNGELMIAIEYTEND